MANVTQTGIVTVETGQVTLQVDLGAMSQAGLDKVFAYGLKKILADAHAGKRGDEALGLAQKRLDALMSGEFRRGGGGRTSDPVKALAKSLAESQWKALGKAVQDAALAKVGGERKEALARIMAKLAESKLAEAKAQLDSVGEVDLEALGL
jgi:hypothetical protein